MPVALPTAQAVELYDRPNALSAYNICLALETQVITDESRMHAQILGYLILHAPSLTAQDEIVRAIHSCAQDEKMLLELGKSFLLWFILPFKKPTGRTPTTSSHPSRRSPDKVKANLKEGIREAPRDHKVAKAQALVRDGYKCVVTGIYDVTAKLDAMTAVLGMVHTELAHILPESTCFDVFDTRTSSADKDYAASASAVLQRFGYDVEKVNGPKVHSLYNVMTMQKDAHDAFDRLEMWFESTGVANCYRVQTTRRIPNVPREVTFTSPDPLVFPFPSQEFLALHAACAKVTHLSGAGEYIDNLDRDTDELDVLAADGSSFAVLTHAIVKSNPRSVSTTM